MAYRIKLDQTKCVGCYACYVACLDAHFQAEDDDAASFRKIRKYTDTEHEFEKSICVGCIHCGKCMQVCPQHAIYQDEETQLILVDQKLCTGCGLCETACPLHVIRFNKAGKMLKCDGCLDRIREGRQPACVKVCCPGAIVWEEIK